MRRRRLLAPPQAPADLPTRSLGPLPATLHEPCLAGEMLGRAVRLPTRRPGGRTADGAHACTPPLAHGWIPLPAGGCREAFQSYIAEDAFFLRSFGEADPGSCTPPCMRGTPAQPAACPRRSPAAAAAACV